MWNNVCEVTWRKWVLVWRMWKCFTVVTFLYWYNVLYRLFCMNLFIYFRRFYADNILHRFIWSDTVFHKDFSMLIHCFIEIIWYWFISFKLHVLIQCPTQTYCYILYRFCCTDTVLYVDTLVLIMFLQLSFLRSSSLTVVSVKEGNTVEGIIVLSDDSNSILAAEFICELFVEVLSL